MAQQDMIEFRVMLIERMNELREDIKNELDPERPCKIRELSDNEEILEQLEKMIAEDK